MTDPAVDPEAAPHEGRSPGAVHNVLSGQAGPSVQAGSIHGGVTVHFHGGAGQRRSEASGARPPREWPVRSELFVNQRAALEAMSALWASFPRGVAPVLALTGPGGVGKTAVAAEWLDRTRSRFPGGELYADLGGPDLAVAARLETVLSRFLVELGVSPKRLPVDLTSLASLFRSVTAELRVAILLDNPVTVSQVRHLLPGSAASTLVITSRRRFDWLAGLVGARIVEIGRLENAAAVELLVRLVPDGRVHPDDDAVCRLADLCDGLPLALRAVGGTLATRPERSLARTVARLSGERARRDGLELREDQAVRLSLDHSYTALSPSAARMYRLLGLHPGVSFTLGAAGAAADVTAHEAAETLDLLVEANLVTESADERFSLHSLNRRHARTWASQEDDPASLRAALRRLLRWYLDEAVRADLALMPGRWRLNGDYDDARSRADGPDTETAWSWLEAERANLVAAVTAAAEQGCGDLVWKLCEAMWSLLFLRGYHQDWVTTHELALDAATGADDQRAQGRIRCQLGMAYQAIGRLDEAGEQFAAAYAADLAAGHQRGQATARELLGSLEQRRGRHDAAVELFTDALSLTSDPRAAGILWRHLATAHLGAGRPDAALPALDRAAASLSALTPPDRYNEIRTETVRAKVLLQQGRARDARAILTTALEGMRTARARAQQADIHAALAEAHLALADRVEAAAAARVALAAYAELDSPPGKETVDRLREIAADVPPRSD